MKREKALALINDLYGLEACYVQAAIDELGEAALSDHAVIWIANQQLNEEQRKGRWLERVAAYQDKHPTWVGKPAKKTSRWACNKHFGNCGQPLSPAFVQRPLCWAIFRRERIENFRQCLGPRDVRGMSGVYPYRLCVQSLARGKFPTTALQKD
jgi:hypothetical protein